MPLVVHRSSQAERLARRLAEILAPPPAEPFARDVVAVHSGGLEQWLSMQIAHHNGICAGVDFPHPHDLVASLAALTLGETTDPDRTWTSGPLLWALLASIPEVEGLPAVAEVRSYLDANGPSEKTLRTVTLCQRLARVFQAYGTYRPELVRGWQTARADEPWEAPLWRAVEHRLGATHPAAWAARLQGQVLPALPGRICLFSVSTLPPLLVDVLHRLSGTRPVHVFALHPSPGTWLGGSVPQHPLLASMGTLARDFEVALLRHGDGVQHELLTTEAPPRDSLLHALQADLHDDRIRPWNAQDDDRSLGVHICTSPLRQVQVLRDALLDMLDRHRDLHPRDVVVMCPDIETYAPLLEAVFGDGAPDLAGCTGHPGGFPSLPFRLADRGVRSANQAAEALLQVLDLADARLDAPAVIDLLSFEPVRARFGLAADDLTMVRELLVQAGARWGRDGAHRQAHQLPRDERFTWRFALDRLLLGQALADPTRATLLGHAPDCDLEGQTERAVLGGLVDFAETLMAETAGLADDRPPHAWLERLVQTADRLLEDPSERGWQKGQVIDTLDELARHARGAGPLPAVDLRTIRVLLQDRFSAREPGRGFMNGAITVCQLVPLRSIPFEVVCLLGIDDPTYPRIEPRPGYDRMALDRRRGDRNARSDDRALFLEALQSARRAVLITCTGRSEHNGREVPLSVPVAELLEAVRQMAPGASAQVARHHPLQPWSPALFEVPVGHDRRMAEAASAWRIGRRSPEPQRTRFAASLTPATEWPTEMTVDELVRFWRHPPTDLVRRRLALQVWEDDVTLEGALPQDLDGLQRWAVRDVALRAALDGEPLDDEGPVAHRLLRGARIPLGTPGQLAVEGALDEIRGFTRWITPLLAGPRGPVDLDVGQGLRVSGRAGMITDSGRVCVHPGTVHPRHKLDTWLHHLMLHASGWTGRSWVLGPRGGVSYGPLERRDAVRLLSPFGTLVRQSYDAPLLFWADVCHDWLQGQTGEYDDDDARAWAGFRGALKAWRYRRDVEKLVDGWILGDANPFHPNTRLADLLPASGHPSPTELAALLWQPALAHQREEWP